MMAKNGDKSDKEVINLETDKLTYNLIRTRRAAFHITVKGSQYYVVLESETEKQVLFEFFDRFNCLETEKMIFMSKKVGSEEKVKYSKLYEETKGMYETDMESNHKVIGLLKKEPNHIRKKN